MTLVSNYLNNLYGIDQDIYSKSKLLQYIEKKTQRVTNPKSRINIANLYAIYVLVEDYIKVGAKNYKKYIGAEFSILFERQRQLPFGDKLQNHALNSRCNEEFKKFFQLILKLSNTLELMPSKQIQYNYHNSSHI